MTDYGRLLSLNPQQQSQSSRPTTVTPFSVPVRTPETRRYTISSPPNDLSAHTRMLPQVVDYPRLPDGCRPDPPDTREDGNSWKHSIAELLLNMMEMAVAAAAQEVVWHFAYKRFKPRK